MALSLITQKTQTKLFSLLSIYSTDVAVQSSTDSLFTKLLQQADKEN